jgi:hypothetical protein
LLPLVSLLPAVLPPHLATSSFLLPTHVRTDNTEHNNNIKLLPENSVTPLWGHVLLSLVVRRPRLDACSMMTIFRRLPSRRPSGCGSVVSGNDVLAWRASLKKLSFSFLLFLVWVVN